VRVARAVQDAVKELVIFLSEHAPADVAHQTGALLAPAQASAGWKAVLARLECLEVLVPRLRVGGGRGTLDARELMAFVGAALNHANGSVRACAVRVFALIVKEAVRRFCWNVASLTPCHCCVLPCKL
jgi:hypothetical protein